MFSCLRNSVRSGICFVTFHAYFVFRLLQAIGVAKWKKFGDTTKQANINGDEVLCNKFCAASNIENFIMSPAGACIRARICSSCSSSSTWLDSKNSYVFSSRTLFSTPSSIHTHNSREKAIQPAEKPVLENKRTARTKYTLEPTKTREKEKNVWRWEE